MQNYLIIYNGAAGKSNNEKIAKQAQTFLETHGKRVELAKTQSEEEAISKGAKRLINLTVSSRSVVTAQLIPLVKASCKPGRPSLWASFPVEPSITLLAR